mmetsp:Transcript_10949/g.16289  ORF Transcript_10949/g.16289 Transcript_10949/m.16289 type:complete len:200 (-) Transcript_10949:115-714(-)
MAACVNGVRIHSCTFVAEHCNAMFDNTRAYDSAAAGFLVGIGGKITAGMDICEAHSTMLFKFASADNRTRVSWLASASISAVPAPAPDPSAHAAAPSSECMLLSLSASHCPALTATCPTTDVDHHFDSRLVTSLRTLPLLGASGPDATVDGRSVITKSYPSFRESCSRDAASSLLCGIEIPATNEGCSDIFSAFSFFLR